MCGVKDRCKLPERTTLPSAKDVIRCFPLRNNSLELSGFSLDIKSAHKGVVLRDTEQGLLGFCLNDSLYFYRVCPFGAHLAHTGGNVWVDGFFDSSTTRYGFPMPAGFTSTIICGCNIMTFYLWWPRFWLCYAGSLTFRSVGKRQTNWLYPFIGLAGRFIFSWIHRDFSRQTHQTLAIYSTTVATSLDSSHVP